MKHIFGLSSAFYPESSPENWREAREAGFEQIEIGMSRRETKQATIALAEKICADAQAAGMRIGSFHLPFGHPWEPSSANIGHLKLMLRDLVDTLDVAQRYGAPIAVLHASYEPIDAAERAHRLEICRDSVRFLGEEAARRGIRLAVENLPRTCLGNVADELLYITDCGKSAGICFDFNHLLQESHEDFLRKAAPYVVTTHISDYDRVDEKHWLPGLGVIDYPAAVAQLEAAGYRGQWLFELSRDKAVPGEVITAQRLMAEWQSIVKE